MRSALLLVIFAAAALAQDDAATHHRKGQDFASKQQWEDARREYETAVGLDPKFLPVRVDLARLQVLSRQFEAALATLGPVMQADPHHIEGSLIRATALMGMNKAGVGRLFLLETLKEHPDHPELLFELGVISIADQRLDDAEEAFRRLAKVDPKRPRGLEGLVEVFFARKEPQKAMELLKEESSRQPDRGDLHLLYGNVAVRAEQYDIGIAEFRKAQESAAEDKQVDLMLRLGETYRRKGSFDEAIATLRKARELAPENARVLSTLALVLDGSGRKPEAMEVYDAAIKVDPKNGFLLNNLAYLLAETGGDLKRALELAQSARALLPNMPDVADTVGWIYLKGNMVDPALELFRYLVAKRPENATFRVHLGMALLAKGDKEAARRELNDALKNNPSADDRAKVAEALQKLNPPQ
jgi:Flp pilus assembly protein TadD